MFTREAGIAVQTRRRDLHRVPVSIIKKNVTSLGNGLTEGSQSACGEHCTQDEPEHLD